MFSGPVGQLPLNAFENRTATMTRSSRPGSVVDDEGMRRTGSLRLSGSHLRQTSVPSVLCGGSVPSVLCGEGVCPVCSVECPVCCVERECVVWRGSVSSGLCGGECVQCVMWRGSVSSVLCGEEVCCVERKCVQCVLWRGVSSVLCGEGVCPVCFVERKCVQCVVWRGSVQCVVWRGSVQCVVWRGSVQCVVWRGVSSVLCGEGVSSVLCGEGVSSVLCGGECPVCCVEGSVQDVWYFVCSGGWLVGSCLLSVAYAHLLLSRLTHYSFY